MENKCLVLFFLSACLLLPCRAHSGFRICFRQADDRSQYQGISQSCSGYSSSTEPAWSSEFRDSTGGRSGQHTYQWRVEAGDEIPNYKEYRLCFRESQGGIACRGLTGLPRRTTCTGWSSGRHWTRRFYDYTRKANGGCRYSWRIESKNYTSAPSRFEMCRVCFEASGTAQCQGNSKSCSGWAVPGVVVGPEHPSWTLPFHDNTNSKGHCVYQWHLDCTSLPFTVHCPTQIPCKKTF